MHILNEFTVVLKSVAKVRTSSVERASVSRGCDAEGININCSKHVNTCGENCSATGLGGNCNSTCIPNGPLFHQRHKLLGNSVEQSGSWTLLWFRVSVRQRQHEIERGTQDSSDRRENGQFNFCECLPEIIFCSAWLGLIAWFRQTSLVQPVVAALSPGIRSPGIRLPSNRLSFAVGIPNTLGISSFLIQLSVAMVLCHGTYETGWCYDVEYCFSHHCIRCSC